MAVSVMPQAPTHPAPQARAAPCQPVVLLGDRGRLVPQATAAQAGAALHAAEEEARQLGLLLQESEAGRSQHAQQAQQLRQEVQQAQQALEQDRAALAASRREVEALR